MVHYSVQDNHAHFVVEADDKRTLANGMKSLAVRRSGGGPAVAGATEFEGGAVGKGWITPTTTLAPGEFPAFTGFRVSGVPMIAKRLTRDREGG